MSSSNAARKMDDSAEVTGEVTKPLSAYPVGALVPQKHGGALRNGGPGGGGSGRPRDEVRAMALEGAAKAVPRLVAMLNVGTCEHCGRSETDEQQIRVADVLLRYGLGQQKEISAEAVRSKVAATLEIIRAHAPAELAASIVAELRGVWL